MKWLVFVLAGLRGTVWFGCIAWAGDLLFNHDRLLRIGDLSAPQEAAWSAATAVRIIAFYVMARGVDSILRMILDGIKGRQTT